MSKINDILEEAKAKVIGVSGLERKTVIAYNEDDLLDTLKSIKNYPAVGVVYEGMRSIPRNDATARTGESVEVVVALVLFQQGPAVHATDQKRTLAIDLLDDMRDQFLGKRSTATGHLWNFMVEAPAELKENMVCWVQRWSVPLQLAKGSINPVR